MRRKGECVKGCTQLPATLDPPNAQKKNVRLCVCVCVAAEILDLFFLFFLAQGLSPLLFCDWKIKIWLQKRGADFIKFTLTSFSVAKKKLLVTKPFTLLSICARFVHNAVQKKQPARTINLAWYHFCPTQHHDHLDRSCPHNSLPCHLICYSPQGSPRSLEKEMHAARSDIGSSSISLPTIP